MNMKVHHIPAAIYAMMAVAGIPGVIAGGAARDVLHGEEPKDYDIILFGMSEAEVCRRLHSIGLHIGECYENGYEDERRFDFCVKTEMLGKPVDFIGLQSEVTTPQEAVDTFDLSINQVWFLRDGRLQLHPTYPKPGDSVDCLWQNDVRRDRVEKFSQRYPQYDWADALKLTENKQ